jgi:predicted nucleic acid-binding Zn ribbon protein
MNDMAVDFYLRMKEAVTGRKSRDQKRREDAKSRATSQPFQKGRDPVSVADSLNGLLNQFSWDSDLARAEVFHAWPEIVGTQNALNSTPEELQNGQLLVRCKSTAWATQLRLMQNDILGRISADFPDAKVSSIRFVGPDAPSWKKGKYSVPGRGPRDTYG